MARFLAVSFRKVIDTPAEDAIPAVPGSPAVMSDDTPPVELVPEVPGIPAVPAVFEVSHEAVDTMWVESDADVVARDMATGRQRNQLDVDYYELNATPGSVVTKKVKVRTGPRTAAPARETVEIEAGGLLIGSAEIDV